MFSRISLSLVIIFFLGCSPKHGHDDHGHDDHGHGHDDHGHGHDDHGHDSHHDEDELEPVVVTQFTEKTFLFMEYPQLIVGERARFLAHFSILKNGEPAYKGSLDFVITDPSGNKKTISLDKPKRDGLYIPEYTFTKPGKYKAEMILKTDLLPGSDKQILEDLVVYAKEKDVQIEAAEEDPNAIAFLVEQQWKIPVTYAKASKKNMSEQLKLSGEIILPFTSQSKVSSLYEGIISSSNGKSFPKSGDSVERGQILAIVRKPLTITELADFNSNKSAMKSFNNEVKMRQIEIQLKKLELTKESGELSVRKITLETKVKKLEQMKSDGLVTQLDLLEMKSELELVDKKFAATKELQMALQKILESLEKVKTSGAGLSLNDDFIEYKIVAPISGQISVVHKNNGESCSALESLFLIQNISQLHLRVDVPEFKQHAFKADNDVYFQLPGSDSEIISVSGLGGKAINVSGHVDPQTRTLPKLFSLPNTAGTYSPGSFVNIYVDLNKPKEVLTIPESAIVRENGLATVYVIIDGEHFTRRVVRTGIRDKGFVEIVDGLKEGEWVADKGAYLIKLASASSDDFGHGHAH